LKAKENVVFPITDRAKAIDRMDRIDIAGKEVSVKGSYSCRVCGRKVGAMARLLAPGFFVCSSRDCSLVKLSNLMKLFPTPYGPAIHLEMLSVFSKIFDIGPRVLIEYRHVLSRKESLVDAWIELIAWQRAFDLYERLQSPDGYKKGKVSLVPPRKLDEVLALRSIEPLIVIDPTTRLDEKIRNKVRQLKEKGIEGYEAPF
jgi:hypothetical protein